MEGRDFDSCGVIELFFIFKYYFFVATLAQR